MIVEFDTNKWRTIRTKDRDGKWHILVGKCKRCGACCGECKDLAHEVVDGKRIGKCKIQFTKPFMCALYPSDPADGLKPGCGFRWE